MTKEQTLDERLLVAAGAGDLAGVKAVIAAGANPNAKDTYDGRTPLVAAALRSDRDMIEFLLSVNADPRLGDGYGWTPLHRVAQDGRLDLINLLVEAGAKTGVRNFYGWTPARVARDSGFELVARRLEKSRRGGELLMGCKAD